jgi:hypothetical protein
LHHLKGQDHIASFVLHLSLELDFRAVMQNKQGGTGEPCDHQNE